MSASRRRTSSRCTSRMPRWSATSGPSLDAAGRPAGRQAADRPGLPGPARRDPRAHPRPRRRRALPADAAAHRARRPQGDAGGRHRLPRQRHVQDLVRAQLPHPRRQHAAARQRARDHGRGPAVGDDGGDALPEAAGAGGVRRRRLHDELAGDGDRGPARLEPGGADPRGLRLRHDPLEAGGRRVPRLGPDLRQPGLRQVRRVLRRAMAGASRSTEDLVPTLDAAFKDGGVHLVAVPIDYSRTRACWSRSCAAACRKSA